MSIGYWRYLGEEGTGGLKTDPRWPFWSAAGRWTTSHGKTNMDQNFRKPSVLRVHTQMSITAVWTKCSDQVNQGSSYLCKKSECTGCGVSLRPNDYIQRMVFLLPPSPSPPKEFHFNLSHQEERYLIFWYKTTRGVFVKGTQIQIITMPPFSITFS